MRKIKLVLAGLLMSIGVIPLMIFLWFPLKQYGSNMDQDWANGLGIFFWMIDCSLAIGLIVWYVSAMGKRIK